LISQAVPPLLLLLYPGKQESRKGGQNAESDGKGNIYYIKFFFVPPLNQAANV
jgi:hypothetical protein